MADRGRILTVLNYYSPYVSGLSEIARLAAEGAASRGFQVTVLTGRHIASLPESEMVNGVRVLRARPLLFLHKGYLSFQLFTRFRHEIRSADVAHFYLPMLESGPLSMLCGHSIPLIVTYACDLARSRSGALLDALAVGTALKSCGICLKRARYITVTSADYAAGSDSLRGLESKLVEVFPPDKGRRTPPAMPVGPPTQRIGFLGRFVEEKGIDVLLDAAPMVLRRLPGAQFILGGNAASVAGGSEYQRLKGKMDALGASLQIPGHIPEERLQDFYSSLDVFVLPSVNSYESFGIVQVEAMKAGVPVVATDMRGVRIPLRHTGNGVLVAPRDAPALADAIVRVLSEPRFRARTEIFDRACAAFPADRAVDQYEQLYSSLIAGRRGLTSSSTGVRT